MKSEIHLTEEVDNKDRKFGSALNYFPAYVIADNGDKEPALFTHDQITEAMARAKRNPEDIPQKTFGDTLFG